MPRRNYIARKGRRRPSDPRGEYSRAQVAQVTDRWAQTTQRTTTTNRSTS